MYEYIIPRTRFERIITSSWSRSFSALFRVRYWGYECWSFIPLTNRPILLYSAAIYVLLLLCIMLQLHGYYYYCCLLAIFLLSPASFLFASRFCHITPKMLPCCMIACVCPVHDSHPFAVLPYQPAYVCPVLSAPSFFVCRTEGVVPVLTR